ncbi:hypothetical protein WJ73_12405 [Burkholderia ubonensis]|nr:hypothetical protein WJ73_12405 [Burkholderia ubonensis]
MNRHLLERVAPHLPALALLADYRRAWLGRDLYAGVALTAVLVPVGMSYAQAAALPAVTGLYASIAALLAYALLGPSRILVLGPDSALAALIAGAIAPLAGHDPSRAIALCFAEMKGPVKDRLRAYGLFDTFEEANFFPTVTDAVAHHVRQRREDARAGHVSRTRRRQVRRKLRRPARR